MSQKLGKPTGPRPEEAGVTPSASPLFTALAGHLRAGVIVVSPALEVLYTNAAVARFCPELASGQPLVCAPVEDYPAGECLHCMASYTLSTGERREAVMVQTLVGEEIDVQVTADPVRGADGAIHAVVLALEAAHEVRSHHGGEAEARARRRATFLQALIDTIPVPLFFKDSVGVYKLCNQAFAEEVLALPKDQIIGRTVFQLGGRIPAELAAVYHSADRELMATLGTQRYETEVRWSDGSRRTVHFFKSVLEDTNGAAMGIVGVMLDITDRKRAELDIVAAKQEAEEAARSKESFLATMSHEIRTPLSAVIGMADLLADTPLRDEQRELVDMIDQAGTALLKLINDILEVSKAQAGRLTLAAVDFELEELVEGAAELLATQAEEKGLELTCAVAPEAVQALVGDPERLQRILLNLISNAIKFTDHGNVDVRASTVPQTRGRVRLRLEVHDTGIGVPRSRQAAIFDSFVQGDEATARRLGGTGLGLTICRSLTTVMKGRIGLESVPGRGSKFWVEVPLRVSAVTATSSEVPLTLDDARILVVDDNPTSGQVMGRFLARAGGNAAVVQAEAEAQAVVAAAADGAQPPVDLLVIDDHLGDRRGREMITALRLQAGRTVPVVLLTSLGQPAPDGVGERIAGLTKPVRRQRLIRLAAQLLDEAGALHSE